MKLPALAGKLWSVADLRRACIILAAATLAGVAANAVRPAGLPWWDGVDPVREGAVGAEVASISTAQMVRYCVRGGAVIVDARAAEAFAAGHVAGAVNVPAPEAEQELGKIFSMLPMDQIVVIYCVDPHCGNSRSLAIFLIANGYRAEMLRIYPGGWDALSGLRQVPKAGGGQQP